VEGKDEFFFCLVKLRSGTICCVFILICKTLVSTRKEVMYLGTAVIQM